MNKKKLSFLSLIALATTFTVSAETDLSIPNAKWFGKFTGVLCKPFEANSSAPESYRALDVKFENIVTDSTLDNGVLKATFNAEGGVCRYSAIILADNAAQNVRLVESKAYSVTEGVNCSFGKDLLDLHLSPVNKYYYYGHPHNMAIMIESEEAKEICGELATHFGINFVVGGLINRQ